MVDKRERITNDEILDLLNDDFGFDADDRDLEPIPSETYLGKSKASSPIEYATKNMTTYTVDGLGDLEVQRAGGEAVQHYKVGKWGIVRASTLQEILKKVQGKEIKPNEVLIKLNGMNELLGTDDVKKELDDGNTSALRVIIKGEKGIIYSSPLQQYSE